MIVAHREEIESASAKTTSLSSAVAGVRARMDRIARGARAILHNGSLGQLIVLLTLGAVFVGALALLASLLMRVGAPMTDVREKDPPTFYAAHALGFEQSEIASLFNVSPAIVRVQTGIEEPDYGEIVR